MSNAYCDIQWSSQRSIIALVDIYAHDVNPDGKCRQPLLLRRRRRHFGAADDFSQNLCAPCVMPSNLYRQVFPRYPCSDSVRRSQADLAADSFCCFENEQKMSSDFELRALIQDLELNLELVKFHRELRFELGFWRS